MRRLKLLSFAVIVVAALASYMASAALATGPTVLFLSGEGVPVEFNSLPTEPNTILTELQSEVETLKGEGVLLKITYTNLASNLGEYEVLFLKVKKGSTNCNTEGDKTGEVLIPKNEVHLVYDKLGTGTGLGVGLLFLVKKFSIICGSTTTHVEGSALSLVLGINAEQLVGTTTLLGGLHCKNTSGGTPEEATYWNNAGEEEKASLKAELGLGLESACELITLSTAPTTGEIQIDPSKMIEIMG
jgi:hypothetical protein